MVKNQKSKKQILFVFQNFSFMQNFKKIEANAEEFYYLKDFLKDFFTFFLYGISYTFSIFRDRQN